MINPREPAIRPTEAATPQGEQVETVNSTIQPQYKKFSNKNKRKRYLPAAEPQADKTIDATEYQYKMQLSDLFRFTL